MEISQLGRGQLKRAPAQETIHEITLQRSLGQILMEGRTYSYTRPR